jgi:hypothetical protein
MKVRKVPISAAKLLREANSWLQHIWTNEDGSIIFTEAKICLRARYGGRSVDSALT